MQSWVTNFSNYSYSIRDCTILVLFHLLTKDQIVCSNLKGGEGELANLKPRLMAPTKLHNIKLKHIIYMLTKTC